MKNFNIKPMRQPNKIINYWKKEKSTAAAILFSGLIFNGGAILGPIYQGKLIDSVVNGRNLSSTIKLIMIYIGIVGVIQLMRYYKRFYIRCFANTSIATMRYMIFNSIIYRDIKELLKENVGNLMTRVISDVDLCVEGMRKFTTELFDTGVLMMSYFISMLCYDIKITLLSTAFIPFAMILAEKLKKIIYKYSVSYRNKSSEITEATLDLVENEILYRVNGMEKSNKQKYQIELDELQNRAVKANILENSMQPIYNMIAMLGIITVIYLGGKKVIDQSWSIGVFSTYIIMFGAMAVKASKAAKIFNSVQKSQVSWKRIKSYLSEYQGKDRTGNKTWHNTYLEVSDLGISFYNNSESIIENINITAKQGEIIGVTGPIASGKSVFGMAFLGFMEYNGSIKIDGRELNDYSEYERSSMISYMGHKTELLSDTIYQNITLGNNLDITSVLEDVCFEEDLHLMPDGVNTLVGNGGIRLSGGQQARIALARTLVNRNKIIILDDPFAAIDMKTEEKIIINLKKNYRNSIIIIISHRLSIFTKVNKIILLHGDKTVECGTHKELMMNSQLYETIFHLQYEKGGNSYEK